jgi:hypothetical protein
MNQHTTIEVMLTMQDEVKTKLSWKGSTIQRGLEHRSRGIAIAGAITRKRLLETETD